MTSIVGRIVNLEPRPSASRAEISSALAEAVNPHTISEQQKSIRKMEEGQAKAIAALEHPEFVLNPFHQGPGLGIDQNWPTLAHLLEEAYTDLSIVPPSDRAHCRDRALTIIRRLMQGDVTLKLECWKCGGSPSSCKCCRKHILCEGPIPNRCSECADEVAMRKREERGR